MLLLDANDTLHGVASSATSLVVTIYGMEHGTNDTYKTLYQGRPGNTATLLYTTPATGPTFVKTIIITNPTGSSQTFKFWHKGTTDANIILPTVALGIGEWAIYTEDGWKFFLVDGTLKSGNIISISYTPENIANKSTDGTLSANSDTLYPSQKAVKTYADQLIAAADAMIFKGVIDCSGNPNYPAADRGHTYRISVAGKIGGASGINVEVSDLIICLTDGTPSGNQATVGTNWTIAQANIDGAVIGPASVTANNLAQFNGTTGKLIKEITPAAALALGGGATLTDVQTLLDSSVGGCVFATSGSITILVSLGNFAIATITYITAGEYLVDLTTPGPTPNNYSVSAIAIDNADALVTLASVTSSAFTIRVVKRSDGSQIDPGSISVTMITHQ